MAADLITSLSSQEQKDLKVEVSEDYFPQLPNEILSMIFVRLSFPDLARCMRLCKRFKTMLTTQEFWKNYLKANYNFVPVKLDGAKLKSNRYINLDLLMNNWFCFWDDSNEIPGANDPSRYIFRPFPQIWNNGIITPGNVNLFAEGVDYDYYAVNKALHLLLTLCKKCDEFEITSTPYYSTMDSVPDVCLFPWPGDKLPKPEDVLEIFNVHEDIIIKSDRSGLVSVAERVDIIPHNSDVDYDVHIKSLGNTFSIISNNEEHAEELFIWLQELFQPSLMFCSGINTIHPQLYFHLTILSPGWVGGIFTTVGLV